MATYCVQADLRPGCGLVPQNVIAWPETPLNLQAQLANLHSLHGVIMGI